MEGVKDMELNTDIGAFKIKVPQKFVDLFKKAKEEALSNNRDVEYWEQDEEVCFEDWFWETLDIHKNYYGKIVPKDIAEFLVNYAVMNVEMGGGYPIENWFYFKENGYEFGICAFGWTSSCEESKGELDMIGYKEKI